MQEDKRIEYIQIIFPLLGMLFIIFTAYYSCLSNDFVNWDTDEYLLKNLDIRSLNFASIKRMFTSTILDGYSPLTSLSFALEYHFFGYKTLVYHFNNILLHLMVVVLIFLFSRQGGLAKRAALFSAFIFGIHPMHVESVAWVVERKDVLYSLFYMASLCSYMKYLQSMRKKYYFLAMILGLFSILAKAMALSLPLLFFLCDWLQKRKPSRNMFLEKIPVFLYVFLIAWITFSQHTQMSDMGNSANAFLIWPWTFIFYIQKFFFPFVLIPLYSLPQPIAFTNLQYLLSGFAFFAGLYLVYKYREKRWLIFAVLFYFLSIFFLLRFDESDISIVADRFMYLPSLGFCIMLGLIFHNLLDWSEKKPIFQKSMVIVLGLGLSAFLIIKTGMQCRIWKDSFTLWAYVAKKNPGAATGHLNLGNAFMDAGDYKKAIPHLTKAVTIDKNKLIAYSNLGTAHFHLKKYDQAIRYLKNAISINPHYPPALNSLGLVYLEKGDLVNAEKYFLTAVEEGPKFFAPKNNLAIIYEKQNKYAQAEKLYRENLALNPNHYQSLHALLVLYIKENNNEKLVKLGKRVINTNRDPEALIRLGSTLAENKYSEVAIAFLTQAIHLNSQSKIAYVLLGNIYANNKNFKRAITLWQTALRIDPQDIALQNHIEKAKKIATNPGK